jgi:sugar/nucleoside kinase (ribokinase family)
MEAADVVKVNDEEARLLTGQAELEEAIGALGRPESLALITLGKEGCMWRWHGEIGTVAAPDVDVVDTTGVGDAFVGGILAELAARGHGGTGLAGLTPEKVVDVVRFAAAAGSLACTRTGAMSALPTRPEVEALLR